MRPQRPCLDCATLTRNPHGRCRPCQQAHDRQRNQQPTRRPLRTNQWNRLPRGGICWICGEEGSDTLDHITPRSEGGTTTPDNLRPAHRECNSRRGGGHPATHTTTDQQAYHAETRGRDEADT